MRWEQYDRPNATECMGGRRWVEGEWETGLDGTKEMGKVGEGLRVGVEDDAWG